MPRNLLLALAVYRLARLIASDDGPGDVCIKLRAKLGAYDYDHKGRAKTSLGRGVSCPYCVGMYAALGLWLLPKWTEPVITVLGLAGAQAFLQSLGRE